MKVRTKNWIRSAAALAVLTATCSPAQACGGGGGGYSGGGYRGGGYGYSSPSPSTCGSAGYSAPIQHAGAQPYYNSVSPAAPTRFQPANRMTAPAGFSNGQQPGFASQRKTAPSQQTNASFQSAPQQQRQFSGSGTNPFNNQASVQTTNRSNAGVAQPTRQSTAPAQQNVSRPSVAQSQRPTAPAATANSEASALQMLASLSGNAGSTQSAPVTQSSIPEFGQLASATQATADTPAHVGTWSVSLPGDQSVSLTLNDDNTFTWSATKGGSTKSFNGQYRLSNNRLSLVRASDLQQMQGDWTSSANGFVFKVDGDTTGALSFTRS